MLTRKTTNPRLDALRSQLRLLKTDKKLSAYGMAKVCGGLDSSLLTKHFLAPIPTGTPRAIKTLEVLRYLAGQLQYSGPIPTWCCLRYFHRRVIREPFVWTYQSNEVARYAGITRSQLSQYCSSWVRIPDGEAALGLLAFWYAYKTPWSNFCEFFRYDCTVDIEHEEMIPAQEKDAIRRDAIQLEGEMTAHMKAVPAWKRRPCPDWLRLVLGLNSTLLPTPKEFYERYDEKPTDDCKTD